MKLKEEISKNKVHVIEQFGKNQTDSGNTAVQIAFFSGRIQHLTEHLKIHRKDFSTRRGLLMLIGRRRKLIQYLMQKDREQCQKLMKELKIRPILPKK